MALLERINITFLRPCAECDEMERDLVTLDATLLDRKARLTDLQHDHALHLREAEMLRAQIAIGQERRELGQRRLEARRYAGLKGWAGGSQVACAQYCVGLGARMWPCTKVVKNRATIQPQLGRAVAHSKLSFLISGFGTKKSYRGCIPS